LEKVEKIFTLAQSSSSQTTPKGNADSKQRLTSSHQFFKFHKSRVNKRRTAKYQQEQLSAAKQKFLHNRCKNKPSKGK
jgi:hypothetical protein